MEKNKELKVEKDGKIGECKKLYETWKQDQCYNEKDFMDEVLNGDLQRTEVGQQFCSLRQGSIEDNAGKINKVKPIVVDNTVPKWVGGGLATLLLPVSMKSVKDLYREFKNKVAPPPSGPTTNIKNYNYYYGDNAQPRRKYPPRKFQEKNVKNI